MTHFSLVRNSWSFPSLFIQISKHGLTCISVPDSLKMGGPMMAHFIGIYGIWFLYPLILTVQGGASIVDHFSLVFVMFSCRSRVICWERTDLLALVCDV